MNDTPIQPIHTCFDKTAWHRIRRIDLLAGLSVSFLLAGLVFFLNPLSAKCPVEPYLLFAKNPFSFREFPYGARMLTPVLVGLLPLDINTGFRLVAFVSYVLCGTFLTLWLRLAGIRLAWSIALLPAFYFATTARFIAANAWYIDPMSYWTLVAALVAIMTANRGATLLFLALGALNRPESLSLLPILFIAWWRKDQPFRSLIIAGLCALPAIAFALSMRFLWPLISDFQVWQSISGTNFKSDPQPYSLIFAQQGFKALLDPQVYRETLPYLWGFAFLGIMHTTPRIRWMMALQMVLAILPMMIATDYFRLPFYVFPSLIFLAGLGLQSLHRIHPTLAGSSIFTVWGLLVIAPNSIVGGFILAIAVNIAYWILVQKPKESCSS